MSLEQATRVARSRVVSFLLAKANSVERTLTLQACYALKRVIEHAYDV